MITIERLARIAMEDMAIRDVIYYSDVKDKEEDWQDESGWDDDDEIFMDREDIFSHDNCEDDYEEEVQEYYQQDFEEIEEVTENQPQTAFSNYSPEDFKNEYGEELVNDFQEDFSEETIKDSSGMDFEYYAYVDSPYSTLETPESGSEMLEDALLGDALQRGTLSNESYTEKREEKSEAQLAMDAVKKERKALEDLYKKFEEEKKQFRSEMKKLNQKASDERKRLKEEESFFDKKMNILKGGFAQLEADRNALEREKCFWERERLDIEKRKDSVMREDSMRIFFVGVNNPITLKKRYRDLIKIFHPDNMGGDNGILQKINKLYESMWAEMGWQKKA